MKKWQFPFLFVTIVAAVAIGMNFGTLYDSAMFSMTGDCKYWSPSRSSDLMNDDARRQMSIPELTCALQEYTEETRRKNDAF